MGWGGEVATSFGGWHPDFARLIRRCAHAAYAGAPGLPEAWAAVFGRVAEALSCFVVCATSPQFLRFEFFLCVAQKQNYKDGIVFTENNIVQYLAELEEYISSLITYTAFKKDDKNAAISSIPLEKLNEWKFDDKKM